MERPAEETPGDHRRAINDWIKDNPTVRWSGSGPAAGKHQAHGHDPGGTPPDFYDEDPKVIEKSIGKAGQALDLPRYLKKVKAYQSDKTVLDTFSKGFFNMTPSEGRSTACRSSST